jgi:hypothetical protein
LVYCFRSLIHGIMNKKSPFMKWLLLVGTFVLLALLAELLLPVFLPQSRRRPRQTTEAWCATHPLACRNRIDTFKKEAEPGHWCTEHPEECARRKEKQRRQLESREKWCAEHQKKCREQKTASLKKTYALLDEWCINHFQKCKERKDYFKAMREQTCHWCAGHPNECLGRIDATIHELDE